MTKRFLTFFLTLVFGAGLVQTGYASPDTDLIRAVETNNVKAVKQALARGANPRLNGSNGENLIVIAAEEGSAPIVQQLLDAGVDPNTRQNLFPRNPVLGMACNLGKADVVKTLIKAGADVNAKVFNGTPLVYAAYTNQCNSKNCPEHIEIIKSLIAAGADVNAADDTIGNPPLLEAAERGFTKAVKILLAAGANVNATGMTRHTALHYAASEGHAEIVKILLAAGADVNAEITTGDTALVEACSDNKDDKIVKLLLKAGADANPKNVNNSPLIEASRNGNVAAVKALLKAGADINAKSGYGWTALGYAMDKKHDPVIKELLLAGATLGKGDTPLIDAVGFGYEDVVKTLINRKVNVNVQAGPYKVTALMTASGAGNLNIVKMLVKAGANVNIKSAEGFTALDAAKQEKHWDVVNFLKSKGAR